MKYAFQHSLGFYFSALQSVPETAGTGFVYLDELLEVLSQLVTDTDWPESLQGEFLDFVAQDVYEFSLAIRTEASASRWSVAASLGRTLQERSEFLLAAAVDSSFPIKFAEFIESQVDKGFAGRVRNMNQEARGTISRWEKESTGQDELLELSKSLHKFGSIFLHHGIGLSAVSADSMEVRRALLRFACGRVGMAMANALLAIKVVGLADTKAWHRGITVVFRS